MPLNWTKVGTTVVTVRNAGSGMVLASVAVDDSPSMIRIRQQPMAFAGVPSHTKTSTKECALRAI